MKVFASIFLFALLATDSATHANAEMVLVPSGLLTMGSDEGPLDERPARDFNVGAFYLDRTPVTVADFAVFVQGTKYQTDAEKFGDSAVFSLDSGRWSLIKGATWQTPFGSEGDLAINDHPVTQVSWQDANNYCHHLDKRLPTEAEWEHASRNGKNDTTVYAFGDELVKDGVFLANVWNGEFPFRNTGDDGYLFTSPVGSFATTPLGLTDMAGNVWEWTADWYLPYGSVQNPKLAKGEPEKVQRGGSFLCDQEVCHGYRSSSRSHSTPESAHMHVGFRCAK